MSPEQVRGDALDGRSDVYSLGCALYEAATGRPPFIGDGSADVASIRLRELPVPPRQVAPGLSVGLEDVILRAMAVQVTTRPDAAALASALGELVDRQKPPRIPSPREAETTETTEAAAGRQQAGGSHSDSAGTDEVDSADRPPSGDAPVPGAGLRRVGIALVVLGVLAVAVLLVVALSGRVG
jgi:serine/threonine-protein kinase